MQQRTQQSRPRREAKQRKHKPTLAGSGRIPLGVFSRPEMPDHQSIKMVYSDYRPLVASGGIIDYVYRANSLFDPDASGVGGQPQGFDQWKTLYAYYRVVAVKVEVMAASNTSASGGLLTVAFADQSSSYASPEELAGTRHSVASSYTDATPAHVSMTVRVSELFGMTDEAVLGDINCRAAVGANPTNQYYIHVACECSTTTLQTMVWVKLTYYTRFEWPAVTVDAAERHRHLFAASIPALVSASSSAEPTNRDGDYCSSTPSATAEIGPRGSNTYPQEPAQYVGRTDQAAVGSRPLLPSAAVGRSGGGVAPRR